MVFVKANTSRPPPRSPRKGGPSGPHTPLLTAPRHLSDLPTGVLQLGDRAGAAAFAAAAAPHLNDVSPRSASLADRRTGG